MSSLQLVVLALTLTAPAPKASGLPVSIGDWPQWQGPNRDAKSNETGLLPNWPQGGPKLLFKTDKLGAGYSGPAVVGNKLVILGAEGVESGDKEFVVCLDAMTGNELWRTPIETADGKYLYQWGSGPRSTPTIDGEFVYVLGAKGDLLCLNMANGKKVWGKNLVKNFGGGVPGWGYAESVLIDGDKLVCTPGGNKGAIIALNKKTGEQIWRCEDLKDPANYSSLVISEGGGVRQYVTLTGQSSCSVRASDGKLLWRRTDLGYKVAVIPTPVVHDDYVFVTAGYGAGCELMKLSSDGSGGVKAEKVYTSKVITNHHGGVVAVGDFVYGHSDQGGQWVCLPFTKTGDEDGPKPEWTSKKLDKGSVSYADGHLYCYGEGKGDVVLVKADPKDWIEDGRFTVPEKSKIRPNQGKVWTHPVIAHGKLYLRDYEWLFCYDVSGK
jgi:outer membrane protein assembly factor BamB